MEVSTEQLTSKIRITLDFRNLVEQKTEKIIEELSTIDRAYFGKDRPKIIKAKIEEAMTLLDSRPIDQGKI